MFKLTSSGIPTCSVSLLLQYSSRLISSRASQEPQERFDDARLATGLTRTPAEQRNNGRNDKASEPKRHDKVERTELCYLLSSLCPARLGSGNHRLFLPVRFIVAPQPCVAATGLLACNGRYCSGPSGSYPRQENYCRDIPIRSLKKWRQTKQRLSCHMTVIRIEPSGCNLFITSELGATCCGGNQ